MTAVRKDEAVHETTWQRLFRIATARRERLGLTLTALQAAGGPSPAWVNKLQRETGVPSQRHVLSLKALDRALRWPEGTSWGLLTKDRTTWTAELLDDEEQGLVEEADEIANFAWLVEQRLRALPEADVEPMMRAVGRVLGMPIMDVDDPNWGGR